MMDKEIRLGPMAAITYLIENGHRHNEWPAAGLLHAVATIVHRDADPDHRDETWVVAELDEMIDNAGDN